MAGKKTLAHANKSFTSAHAQQHREHRDPAQNIPPDMQQGGCAERHPVADVEPHVRGISLAKIDKAREGRLSEQPVQVVHARKEQRVERRDRIPTTDLGDHVVGLHSTRGEKLRDPKVRECNETGTPVLPHLPSQSKIGHGFSA